MKKKTWLIAGMVLVIAMLAACSSPAEETTTGPDLQTEESAQSEPTEAPVSEATEAPAEDEPASDDPAPAGGAATYNIVSAETEARFIIQEILLGEDTTVIGATNDVTGSITVDLANPQGVSMSAITIGVDSLATDNTNRNRTMHNSILESATYPMATFAATSFATVPATVAVGESFDYQITGDLTIHGTTQSVTFDATATVVSETRIEGTARLDILYEDYGIQILRLPPSVASVEDDVILEIDFVAQQ